MHHAEVRPVRPTTSGAAALEQADFACAYAIEVLPGDGRTSEEWARTAWEGAPRPLRWFMRAGWRYALGLRLGPPGSGDHILGWRIVDERPGQTVCEAHSRLLKAYNVFSREDGRLVWSTFVFYGQPVAPGIWRPASLLHRLLVPRALRRAQSRSVGPR